MGFLKNMDKIATSRERKLVLDILEKTIEDCSPSRLVKDNVSLNEDVLKIMDYEINLSGKNVFLIGAGKSAGHMAEGLNEIMGEYFDKGFINTTTQHGDLGNIRIQKSSYPAITKQNLNNTKRILSLAEKVKEDDVVLLILSRGSSSMLAYPAGDISEDDFIEAEKTISSSELGRDDADIIRRHICSVKGGRLSELLSCKIYSLVMSDKVKGDISQIEGAPSDCDLTTFSDAEAIIKKNKIKLPKSVSEHIKKGVSGKIEDTPKIMPTNSKIFMMGSSFDVLSAAKKNAEKRNIQTKEFILSGETEASSKEFCSTLMQEKNRPCMYIGYGKTDKVVKKGVTERSGRNQNFILQSIKELENIRKPWTMLSFNTDGTDSIKGIGGAIIDGSNHDKMLADENLDHSIEKMESKKFLKSYNSLIESEDTSVNLCDLTIAFLGTNWNKGRKNHKNKFSSKNKKSRTKKKK